MYRRQNLVVTSVQGKLWNEDSQCLVELGVLHPVPRVFTDICNREDQCMAKLHRRMILGSIVSILVVITGCTQTPDLFQRILGRDIATYRDSADENECPTIRTFNVSPETVKCGDPVSLEIAATSPGLAPVSYAWEIEGQLFETGQRAIWKTPTCETIGDPEKVYTVRGVATDGEGEVTRSVEVKVLCNCSFDAMVHFEFAKADLDATAKVELDKIGEKLKQNPEYSVLIEGHTDHVGSDVYNKRLGERRADETKRYLISTWHIDPERIITRSFGEEEPIAPNETSDGRAKNRRAEIFRVLLKTK